MEKFLTKTATHLTALHGSNMANVLVLMPNHRSGLYLRQALVETMPQPAWLPQITTLADWITSQSKLALIEPLEQVLELYSLYKLNGGDESIDEFIPVARVMLADFDEVDKQLAAPNAFFDYLVKLQSLKVYVPGEEPTEYAIRYRKFWDIFKALYFGLRQSLEEKGKAYEGMIYRHVAENLPQLTLPKLSIYAIGFSGLSKSEEAVIKTLKNTFGAQIIWDTDKYYTADDYQEAGSPFRRYQREWRLEPGDWETDLLSFAPKKINIVGVAKSIGQTKVVADIIVNKLQLTEAEEKETVVVLPDENMLNPLLAALPAGSGALNISMGFPLRDSPVAELLKAIFSMHDNVVRFKSKTSRQVRFYYKDVFDILHHSYTALLIPDTKNTAHFIETVRRRNQMMVSTASLAGGFQGTQFEHLFWYTESVTEYLDNLLKLADTLKTHFLKLTRDETQDLTIDIELLYHVTNQLTGLKTVLAANDYGLGVQSLRKLLMDSLRSVRVPFEGEPIKGLQIMGALETRCLDFKNVIILSMNEGKFPADKMQFSYIPFEMRHEFLSTYRERDAESAYLFYRLLQRAENVYLVYNTESDDLGGGEKSRFILQLQHELKAANKNAAIEDFVYSVDPPPAIPEDDIVIHKDEELLNNLVDNLTGYGISPSAINTYINCSLQYYLRYVAKLHEKDEIEESIEAASLGSAVHYVLENLYKEMLDKPLSEKFVDETSKDTARIETLLRESFSKRFDAESLQHGRNYLLFKVCLKLIDEFLKHEKANLKLLSETGGNMKLLMLENELTATVNVAGKPVIIRGKIDRVEQSGGSVNIADYKTGTPDGSLIKSDDISLFATDPQFAKAMQLLTYAWLYAKNNSGNMPLRSGIYWLRQMAGGFDALSLAGNEIISPQMLETFQQVLQNTIAGLINPDVPFTKTTDPARCTNCEFAGICRRNL
ncbi:MAG TPA: PD-(D/E)XK nuclease family protein [Chitinophagales bacterium]|nr:PD-(D/E)XK nuclease family protein [Chitinophagales bacterium]